MSQRSHAAVATQLGVLLAALATFGLVPVHLSPGAAGALAGIGLALLALALLASGALAVWSRGFDDFLDPYTRPGAVPAYGGVEIDPELEQWELAEREREAEEAQRRRERRRPVTFSLVALAFFLVWALLLMAIWAADPQACPLDPDRPCEGAFRGLGERPAVGDFLYLSVNATFVNLPADITAASRVARTAVTLVVVTGVATVTAYASHWLGVRRAGD